MIVANGRPVVSAVVPCYDSAPYLRETFASLEAQTLSALEIILVDDGSTDGTSDIIAELIAGSGRIVRTVWQANAGLAAARNRGVGLARGRYIMPLDADDLIAPETLEACVSALDADPDVSIIYFDREEFGDVAALWPAGSFALDRLRYFNQLSYCTLYRRSLWEALGGYRTNVTGLDDWDFWVNAAACGFQARYIPEPFLKHRKRAGSQMWRLLDKYDRLFAKIILNNRAVYSQAEVSMAEALLVTGESAPLFRATRAIFMANFLGKAPRPIRNS